MIQYLKMQFNEPFSVPSPEDKITVMNKRAEPAPRGRHQNADDGLKAVKVSLIYHGLLQHEQAFMIKAMTRFSRQLHSLWFEHTVGVKGIGLDL